MCECTHVCYLVMYMCVYGRACICLYALTPSCMLVPYHMCACMHACVCVRACVRVCGCACVCVREGGGTHLTCGCD